MYAKNVFLLLALIIYIFFSIFLPIKQNYQLHHRVHHIWEVPLHRHAPKSEEHHHPLQNQSSQHFHFWSHDPRLLPLLFRQQAGVEIRPCQEQNHFGNYFHQTSGDRWICNISCTQRGTVHVLPHIRGCLHNRSHCHAEQENKMETEVDCHRRVQGWSQLRQREEDRQDDHDDFYHLCRLLHSGVCQLFYDDLWPWV